MIKCVKIVLVTHWRDQQHVLKSLSKHKLQERLLLKNILVANIMGFVDYSLLKKLIILGDG